MGFSGIMSAMDDLFTNSKAGVIELGGIKLNRIGLGTNRVTDTDEAHELLRFAVSSGLNFIDTAYIYTGGNSETTIGKALSPYDPNLVVATKGGMGEERTGNNEESYLRANLAASLKRLKTDCISLYQIHRLDTRIPIQQTMELLKSFQAEGKIRHIGLSEVNLDQLQEALKYAEVASVQNHYNLSFREHDKVLDFCGQNNIIFIPFFPLRDVNDSNELQAKLQPLADKYKLLPQQLILAWLLKKSKVMLPIPGTLSIEHLKDNIASSYIEMSDEDFNAIDQLS